MNLKPFVGQSVLLQLRQPHQYQLARADGKSPIPFAVSMKSGQPDIAEPGDPSAQGLTVATIAGTLLERNGAFLVEYVDQSDGKRRLEVAIHPDLIGYVTVVAEEKLVSLIS